MELQELREKAMKLPLRPGVYIMKDTKDAIIYIGKAKALKNRVSQYFGSQKHHTEKVRQMVQHVDHFDYILCESEFEALVLECSLIKQHQPKYNILLKDDKGYSYIRISHEPWRRISFVMQKNEDGAEYLGPYMSAWYAQNAVDGALKIFGLPTCHKRFPQDCGKGRPCLNYYIKQCCAPCSGKVSQEDYDERVRSAVDFLKKGDSESIRRMTEQMNAAAEHLDFELAAKLRDRILAVKKITQKQQVVATRLQEQDAVCLMTDKGDAAFAVLRFAEGRLYDKEDFLLKDSGAADGHAALRAEFLKRYYAMRGNPPPVITLDEPPQEEALLLDWLTELRGRKVKFLYPQKGEQQKILEMCRRNAAERLAQSHGHLGHELSALDELASLLGLPEAPEFIESYDISNLMGSENVAGMVVFRNGRPYKSAYRRFAVKGFVGQDDYASMQEVLTRRIEEYFKNKDSGEGFGRLPDLILLDGGKGQVSAVREVLQRFQIDVPLYGMVKDSHHRTRAITDEGREIAITAKRQAFTLVSSLQDEVHRFAISYHRAARKKHSLTSSLTEIEGIGTERAKSLLAYFKTLKRIRQAEIEELMQAPRMNRPAAEAVYRYFHSEGENANENPEELG